MAYTASGFNLSTFDPLFKTVQEGMVQDIFNSDDTFAGMVQKVDDADGRKILRAIRTGRISSHGCQDPDAAMPVAQSATYRNPEIIYKDWIGVIRVNKSVIARSKGDKGSFVRGLVQNIKDMVTDSRDDWNRMLLGDGSGSIGFSNNTNTTAGAAGTNAFILLSDVISGNPIQPEDARKFAVGLRLHFWNSNKPTTDGSTDTTQLKVGSVDSEGTTDGVEGEVYSINLTTGAIGLVGTVGGATGADIDDPSTTYYVTRKGARSRTISREFMGLNGIVDDGDPPMNQAEAADQLGLNALTVAANPTWTSHVDSNSGVLRPVTSRILTRAIDACKIRGGGRPTHFIVPFGVRMEYAETQGNVRRNVNTAVLSGTTTGGFRENVAARDFIEFNGIPFMPDKYAPQNTIIAADLNEVRFVRTAKPEWVDEDGSILRRSLDSTLSFEAHLYCAGNLMTFSRSSHAKIEDVQGDDPT